MLFTVLFLLPLAGHSQETQSYCSETTTWNGVSWSNGEPSANKDVIILADYTFNNNTTLNACSLYVKDNAHVLFTQRANAIIVHNITVSATASLVFDNESNLLQTLGNQNTGKVTVKRNSSKIKRNDFTLWSSPVSGQTLLGFSPQTLANRFYTYSTQENIYNTVQNPAVSTFGTAKGYLIRAGEDQSESPEHWQGVFTGTPNTGDIALPLTYISDAKAFNAVGNPYPSPINVKKFLEENSQVIDGTIWLWRKTDDAAKSSYATVTKLGYQANTQYDSENTIENPYAIDADGILNTGQGFIVKAQKSENLVFNNNMRESVNSDIFFRTANGEDTLEASRFWINVTANDVFSQALVGYTADATTGYDYGMDGESIMDGGITLYTLAGAKKLAIQARPGFTTQDSVALGFKTQQSGTFTLSIDHLDGLFSTGQDIFIKDATTNTLHNLTDGNYTFTSAAGTFENRFTIIYSQTLGTDTPQATAKEIVVYSNNKQVKVQSTEEILSVTVYDMLGRTLYENDAVNNTEFSSAVLNGQQVVITKTTLTNGAVISKKILLQ